MNPEFLLVALCWFASSVATGSGEKPVVQQGLRVGPDTGLLYNATTSFLAVSSGITLSVNDPTTGTVVVSATLPGVDKASVTGAVRNQTSLIINSMDIEFHGPIEGSSNSTFSDVKLHLELSYDPSISTYWNLSSMTVDYKAVVPSGGGSYSGTKEPINVAPKPGFSLSPSDVNCQRGYTVCAPRALSWTCNDELFVSKRSSERSNATAVSINFPGLQLQPFYDKGRRFGFNWDCDPLISSTLWVSLIMAFLLLMTIYSATYMLMGVFAPDRFDDPKGKQIIIAASG